MGQGRALHLGSLAWVWGAWVWGAEVSRALKHAQGGQSVSPLVAPQVKGAQAARSKLKQLKQLKRQLSLIDPSEEAEGVAQSMPNIQTYLGLPFRKSINSVINSTAQRAS